MCDNNKMAACAKKKAGFAINRFLQKFGLSDCFLRAIKWNFIVFFAQIFRLRGAIVFYVTLFESN